MKIKLAVSSEIYRQIEDELKCMGIEIDDEAELILSEKDKYVSNITVKTQVTNEYVRLAVEDIIFIETFGHKVVVHTEKEEYLASDRLYQLCSLLDPKRFLRISNSVVIATNKVTKIKPTFSMKYVLTMSNGKNVDVTRGYYNLFREHYNI